jgi:hypothetical protein
MLNSCLFEKEEEEKGEKFTHTKSRVSITRDVENDKKKKV